MGTFSERLREEIDYLGLTRKELAYKANVKIRALDMYIGSQGSMPPADVAVRLAKALNVTVEYLVTGEKTKSDNLHSEKFSNRKGFKPGFGDYKAFFREGGSPFRGK